MKEIVILVLSISMVSALAGTANAMRSFLNSSDPFDTQETSLVSVEDECELSPVVYDQPPEDEEDWPGCRD